MRKRWLQIYVLIVPFLANAQRVNIDSLLHEANNTKNDTIRLVQLKTITRSYAELNPDSSLHYSEVSLALARKLGLKIDEGAALQEMGYAYLNKGNYPRSLQILLSAIAILNDPRSERGALVGNYPGDDELMYRTATPHLQRLSALAFTELTLGILYTNSNIYEKASYYSMLSNQKAVESGNLAVQSIVNLTMNRVYLSLKKNDSALISIQKSYEQATQSNYKRYLGSVLLNMGRTYAALGNISLANDYYRRAILVSTQEGYFRGIAASDLLLADYYMEKGKRDSVFLYIEDGLANAQHLNAPDLLLRSYTALSRYYHSTGNNDSIVKYQALMIKIKDSLFNDKQAQQFQNIDFDEEQRQQQVETAKKDLRASWRMYSLLAGLFVFLFIAIMLWRNSLQRKKANLLLSKQKSELESTLVSLKETQKQLIQSEKMASLGELTAGIAHEIQNPLNFVNNFCEVNNELIEELKSEKLKVKSERDVELENQLLDNIEQNLEKINHHGKRAEAIVKGMLQHSRTSSGQKELSDINKLADEYLRLAYHGLRAKDKGFNSEIKTEFDDGIEKINVVPQEIGRVILNLVNNAFYAVSAKASDYAKASSATIATTDKNYEPTVIVTTKKEKDKVSISVADNGDGIPPKNLEKIFQPFFTTKPAGQGTGLGLSLAYDIVKAHGGEIKVQTIVHEGTEFTIQLPIV